MCRYNECLATPSCSSEVQGDEWSVQICCLQHCTSDSVTYALHTIYVAPQYNTSASKLLLRNFSASSLYSSRYHTAPRHLKACVYHLICSYNYIESVPFLQSGAVSKVYMAI